jgi:hypothetical protein
MYVHKCRRLEMAHTLVRQLLAVVVQAARDVQPAGMPLHVAAHYLRSVVDWLISSLLSKPPHQHPSKSGAPGTPPAATAAQRGQQLPKPQPLHPRENPRCWELLAAALEAGAPLLQGANISATLSSAAAAACGAAAGWAHRGRAAGLAAALLRALGVLGRRYALSYRPTLEQQLALLAAALQVAAGRAPSPPTRALHTINRAP